MKLKSFTCLQVLFILIVLFFSGCRNQIKTPLEKSDYTKLTTHNEVNKFIGLVNSQSELIDSYDLCSTSNVYTIKYAAVSNSGFGEDAEKVKVLIFAQQHGNEQSGKEACLRLLKNIYDGDLDFLLDKLDLLIIPQLNPFGGDRDKRRNGNNVDLNRNHLVLSETETTALHQLFLKYKPEVTLDIHEYYPYSKSWMEFGYRKDFDEQFGLVTNPNIDSSIHRFSRTRILPSVEKKVVAKDFTFHEYIVGGAPDKYRIRRSTTHLNDGRNSFGILNTFSFILEGKNGKDSISNIAHRTKGQVSAIEGLLNAVYENAEEIKSIVKTAREKLFKKDYNQFVSVRMEHYGDSKDLPLKLKKVTGNIDTVISVNNFHPIIKSLLKIKKPFGYLFRDDNAIIKSFLTKHSIAFDKYVYDNKHKIFSYKILKMKEAENEELRNFYPEIKKIKKVLDPNHSYFIVPIKQLASNLLVSAFEPQSMLGLIQYEEYRQELIIKSEFQIFRLEI
jgi:hypothetical protein